ncbi:hypothetical protein [Micromonospora sp. LOL_024]|uniref:hypothetical protein n=1 Tax=Micromonospora sp. LOL_024 TaxID=3345412 RepID=UPI003A8AE934
MNKYARSLEVPQRLIQLHPRTPGNAGNFSALPPAVVLGVIAAFEGFVEEFLAISLHARGYGLAQIAKRVTINNPTVADFQKKADNEFPGIGRTVAGSSSLQVWNIPGVAGRPSTDVISTRIR